MAKVQTRRSISVSREKYAELCEVKARTGASISSMVEAAIDRDCPPAWWQPGTSGMTPAQLDRLLADVIATDPDRGADALVAMGED